MNRIIPPPLWFSLLFLPFARPVDADVPYTFNGLTTPVSSANLTVQPQSAPIPQVLLAQGSLLSLDRVFGKLVLSTANGPLTFWIGTNTPIRSSGGLQLSLDDLQPGDSIAVEYQPATLTVDWVKKL